MLISLILRRRPTYLIIVIFIIALSVEDASGDRFILNKTQVGLIFLLPLILSLCISIVNELVIDMERVKKDKSINM